MIPIAGRSKTVENVYRAVFAFSRWLEGHDLADDVTTVRADDIRGWLASLRGKVSPSTEYPSYCRCRQCLAWWVRDSELENLPKVTSRVRATADPWMLSGRGSGVSGLDHVRVSGGLYVSA